MSATQRYHDRPPELTGLTPTYRKGPRSESKWRDYHAYVIPRSGGGYTLWWHVPESVSSPWRLAVRTIRRQEIDEFVSAGAWRSYHPDELDVPEGL